MNINEWMMLALQKNSDDIARMPLNWLEIMRNRWTPLVERAISFLLQNGTFLLCADRERLWLQHYIMSAMNTTRKKRPFLPFYALDPQLQLLIENGQGEEVNDLLEMTYERYALWYIGRSENALAQFGMKNANSLLWMLDGAFDYVFLQEDDSNLDFKLLQAYKIFEQALFAGICGDFAIDDSQMIM